MEELKLLPNIFQYLENIDYNQDCKIEDIDLLVEEISAKQHIDKNIAKYLIILIFNEIRNSMLNGEKVQFRNFGTFIAKSPSNSKYKRIINLKFEQSSLLFKRLNEKNE